MPNRTRLRHATLPLVNPQEIDRGRFPSEKYPRDRVPHAKRHGAKYYVALFGRPLVLIHSKTRRDTGGFPNPEAKGTATMNPNSIERHPRCRTTDAPTLARLFGAVGLLTVGVLGCDRSVVTEEAEPTPSDAARFGPEPRNDETTRIGGQTTGGTTSETTATATSPTAATSGANVPDTAPSASETGSTATAATTTQ